MPNILEHIDIEITNACNLQCVHCSANAGSGEKPDLDRIKRILREAKELGIKRVGITGGEPFLFPNELAELIDFSFDELGCPVHIHSNGQLVERNLDLINARTGKIENLTLSVLGHTSSHDRNTGRPGAYDVLKSAAVAIAKVPVTTTIFVVPMSNNCDDLLKAIEEFYNLGIKRYRIIRLAPGGRARGKFASIKLNEDQAKKFINDIKSLEKKLQLEFEAGFCTRLLFPSLKPLKHHPCCMSGINRLHINIDGDVFPCTASSGLAELSAGNTNRQTLAEIWTNSPLLNDLRSRYPAKECNVQNYYAKHPVSDNAQTNHAS